MLSHVTYKVLHLLGIFLLLAGIGGLWALSAASSEHARAAVRRLVLATHGIALVLILFAGFGMMARLGIMGGWPPWIWIKLLIWLFLAALPVLLRRAVKPSSALFFVAPLLGAVAAWAALFHVGQGIP